MKNLKAVAPKEQNDIKQNTFTVLCESIRPIYLLTRIVGLMASKLEKKDGNMVIVSGKGDYLYLFSFFTTYGALSSYALFSAATDTVSHNIIPQIVIVVESSIIIILMFLTLFFGFLLRKLILKVLTLTAEADDSFKTIDVAINYKTNFKNTIMLLGAMSISSLIRSILNLATINVDFLQQATLFIAVLIKSLSKYCFVLFLLPIASRFQKINNIIKSYFQNKNIKLAYLNFESGNTDMLKKLYILCRLHYKLCNISRLLNTAFAFQLLFSLGVSLTNILFQSYYLYVALSNKFDSVSVAMILSPIVWLLDEIMEVYLLVYACAKTCENANSTSILLHELRNNISNAKLESHIQMYSLQMLHQKIQFSALGFFEIDYTLIYSIIGSVTTYLVIFIQFDQTQDTGVPKLEDMSIDNCSNILKQH